MPGPLTGVKVIDLTAVLLGPFATQHLADMGADVIKVEPPEGDLLRLSGGSMGRDKNMGPIYMAANRNKRSLCLDLKKPRAVEILKRMIAGADLFIHNSRPAAIERLGLGYADLKKINPSIVYAYSLGYARKGPYGHKPAFDDLVQGVSGAASLQTRVDGKSPKFMPSLIADKTTGLHLCIAVLGALYHRKCTGEGQMIEVPMLETLASFWLTEHLFGATWTPERGSMGYDRIINKYRHPFPTKDGYICALPYTDAHWVTFFELAGRPDLAKEQKFVDKFQRPKHFSELYQVLDSLLKDRSTAEWLEAFDKADIPAMPVNSMEQLLEDPHLTATGFFTDREHPSEGPIKTFASPLDFEKTKVEYRHHAPRLGGDGVEVLREAGISDAEIEALKADKTLIVPGMIPAATSGTYPPRDGNLVRVLIGGAEAFARIAKAVDTARERVWVTVAFYADDFRLPDGRGVFELLAGAAARGVDVRAIFWRPNAESAGYGRTYPVDSPARPGVKMRWDRAAGPYVHHQKSWMIDDAGFVGGINLTAQALARHDAYAEVRGPCAADVARNFVERWNGVSEPHENDDLPLPSTVFAPCGPSLVQIQRMFRNDTSILEQYERAIDAAERSIYIENQAIPIPAISARLEAALKRGVDVLLLVPADPEESVYKARENPSRRALFDGLESLGRYPTFRFAGLSVYVHCKLMIVDDAWATIGSCNLHSNSLGGHSEMNASIWDAAVVRDLRERLRARHANDLFTLSPELYGVRPQAGKTLPVLGRP